MPSTGLMNICTDFVIKAVKIESSFSIHKSTCQCKNPKRTTLAFTAFVGCIKFQLFGGIWRDGGDDCSATLPLGKKITRKQHKTCW